MSRDMITVTFEVEVDSHAELKKLAEDGYRTLAAEVRLAIDEHIEAAQKKARRKSD